MSVANFGADDAKVAVQVVLANGTKLPPQTVTVSSQGVEAVDVTTRVPLDSDFAVTATAQTVDGRRTPVVAELLASVHAAPLGARTVVVYTSDHGEAFREHGQLGHTGAVLEEEIHVPTWIDAPVGLLMAACQWCATGSRELSKSDVLSTTMTSSWYKCAIHCDVARLHVQCQRDSRQRSIVRTSYSTRPPLYE